MKRFVYIMVLTPVSVLSILTMVYLFKLDEPLVFIKSVKVTGLKQVEYKDLMQRVSPYLRESIFRVDVSRIRKGIIAHPFIKDVRIKKVYPSPWS
jgi:cell division septal protein FtsQ